MTPDELKKRTKQFALRILKLVAALPNTVQGRAIASQLVRAGTAVAANYRPHAVDGRRQSSLPRLASLKKRQMKVLFGWN